MQPSGADVVLVGFQDQANLGMGYVAAVLEREGHRVELLDFREPVDELCDRVLELEPEIVGFSLIFQFFLEDFNRLADALRAAGVDCHFTIGGHYPSLCPGEVLELMPEIDSVVQFEGEYTLLELLAHVHERREWQDVAGVIGRASPSTEPAHPRALIQDLDELPFPIRVGRRQRVLGIEVTTLLASRGCVRRCSFCSIHTFYRTAPGKVVRVRSPANVVDEMRSLHGDRRIGVFLFLDDDFPMWGKPGRRWVMELVDELRSAGLADRVIWKISCRAEYVETELFTMLRDAGLYLVYMGLESGTEAGLEVLHKQSSVEDNLHAVRTLKELGLMFEYGFMLFDPASTFASVRENVAFLRDIVGDGSAGATFCRMLPYGGTPIRDQLAAEGRLRGNVTEPDYEFLEPGLGEYHGLLDRAVGGWIHGDGVSHDLNWAWHEITVIDRLIGELPGASDYRRELAALTARSNDELLTYVDETSTAFERHGDASLLDVDVTEPLYAAIRDDLLLLRDTFIADNQATLMDVILPDHVQRPLVSPHIV